MTKDGLRKELYQAEEHGLSSFMLAIPDGARWPRGFVKGELLCANFKGRVYKVRCDAIRRWLHRQGEEA